MARRKVWDMNPGETKDLAASMVSELDSDAVMTGATPTVSAWTLSGTTYSAAAGFTFNNQQVNAGVLTTEAGETIPVGKGIAFRVTAPSTQGTYYIRSECDADDGTHPVRYDKLVVSGPGAPS